jgi:hypothetical protein
VTTLIKVGCLLLTPSQLQRALDEDLTISQTLEMVRRDKEKEDAKVNKED